MATFAVSHKLSAISEAYIFIVSIMYVVHIHSLEFYTIELLTCEPVDVFSI